MRHYVVALDDCGSPIFNMNIDGPDGAGMPWTESWKEATTYCGMLNDAMKPTDRLGGKSVGGFEVVSEEVPGNLDIPPELWLRRQFEYEYCSECGGDTEHHTAVPFEGNWFAYCHLLSENPMTFRKDQVMTNEEWAKIHEGHDIEETHEDFELTSPWVRRLYWKHCKTCEKKHLYKMENVNPDTGEKDVLPSK